VKRLGDVTLRLATAADPPQLPRVEDAAGELFAEIGMPEIAAMPARDVSSLQAARAEGLLWVADAATTGVVGFAMAERLVESLHLAELSVQPSHGRRGVGAGLVQCVADAALERGYSQLTLSTFVHVPWNAPYYRRLGFEEVDTATLSDELRTVRAREADVGLPVKQRVIMRRAILPPPGLGAGG
jgi:predicted N-acetyltransferase YhbS